MSDIKIGSKDDYGNSLGNGTMRMVQPRDVVTKTVVLDQYDVPFIDFGDLTVEVMDNGKGDVYLNGVLLRGVRLFSHTYNRVTLDTKSDRFGFNVKLLFFSPGRIPTSAKLIDTTPSENSIHGS